MTSADGSAPRVTELNAEGDASKAKHATTTLNHVFNSREAVARLAQQPVNLRAAQKILELKRKVNEMCDAFTRRRDALAAKKGEEIEPGKWRLEPPEMEAFQAEMKQTLAGKVQISHDVCLTLVDIAEAKISAADLELLDYAIVAS